MFISGMGFDNEGDPIDELNCLGDKAQPWMLFLVLVPLLVKFGFG